MATAFINKMLECPICLEEYCQPKALPCQHTFCLEPCLKDLVNSEKNNIECPICRKIHDLPSGGVEKFPNNFTMLELLEESSNLKNHGLLRSEYTTSTSRNTSPVPTAPPIEVSLNFEKSYLCLGNIQRAKINRYFFRREKFIYCGRLYGHDHLLIDIIRN